MAEPASCAPRRSGTARPRGARPAGPRARGAHRAHTGRRRGPVVRPRSALTYRRCRVPHVTFIHGISNKPPASDLLRIWRQTLAGAATPLPLGDLGITSSLVYWADLLYDPP